MIQRNHVDTRIGTLRIEIGAAAQQQAGNRYHNGYFHHTRTRRINPYRRGIGLF